MSSAIRFALLGALMMAALSVAGVRPQATHADTPAVTSSCATPASPDAARCFAERLDVPGAAADANSSFAAPAGLTPSALLNAYNLPASSTTATVAVVDAYDDPTAESDLAAYRAQFGLPACTTANGCFSKVGQTGAATGLPSADSGWSTEISLDVDMVSAICPSCRILLVEANTSYDSDLFTAVAQAVAMGARYVSMSWGGGGEATAYDTVFTPGVAFVASSGDNGYGVSYPASSPHVLAVGGTSLTGDASSARGWDESTWNSYGHAPGSGCSAAEAKPAFQAGIPSSVCANRAVTDVSAVADPQTGVAVYYNGGWGVYGGTSAAAPIVASIYALAGTPAAGTNPASYPYNHPEYLNDVTTGTNGTCGGSSLCTAGAGWDGPTGLGTPDGTGAFSATGIELTRTSAPTPTGPSPQPSPTYPTPVAVNAPSPAPVCGAQRVVNPTFTAGSRGWVATRNVVRRGLARLDGYGRAHTDRLAQAVTLPRGCAAVLRVRLTVSSADSRVAADRLTVTVDGHAVAIATNRSRSGQLVINLTRYAGHRIVLGFVGVENGSRATAFTIRAVTISA